MFIRASISSPAHGAIAARIKPAIFLDCDEGCLFRVDLPVIETSTAYLRIVGPAHRFLGLAMVLYSHPRARRGFIAAVDRISPRFHCGRRRLAFRLTGSLNWLFAALAFGLIVDGIALTAAITSGAWFGRSGI